MIGGGWKRLSLNIWRYFLTNASEPAHTDKDWQWSGPKLNAKNVIVPITYTIDNSIQIYSILNICFSNYVSNIYIYVCVCVCVCGEMVDFGESIRNG